MKFTLALVLMLSWVAGAAAQVAGSRTETPGNIGIWKAPGFLGDTGNAVAPGDLTVTGNLKVLGTQNSVPGVGGGGGPVYMVGQYGADLSGANDATTALQSCLTKATGGGTCMVDHGGKLKILGDVSIPRNTSLMCGYGFADSEDATYIANYASETAIKLAAGRTIKSGGQGATIANCLIYRDGMTFPAANASAFTGLAVSDNGQGNLSVLDSVVIGFGTCLYVTGTRPYVRRSYFDCAGNSGVGANGASVEIDNGNTDAGYLEDIKLQSLSTGNGNCAASIRPGIGLAVNGINFLGGGIVSQNFQQEQIHLSTLVMVNGTLWTDGIFNICGYGNTVGLKVLGNLVAMSVNANSTNTGVIIDAGGGGGVVSIGQLFVNQIGQDCLVHKNGFIQIGQYTGNNPTNNCGRYFTEIPADATQTHLSIQQAVAYRSHGNAPPYFHTSFVGAAIPDALSVTSIATDQPQGTNLYGGFSEVSGADKMMAEVNLAQVTCTGLGTGTCAPGLGSDVVRGEIFLTPSAASSTGTVVLAFPLIAQGRSCATQYVGPAWTDRQTAPLIETAASPTQVEFTWSTAVALLPSITYAISYQCRS